MKKTRIISWVIGFILFCGWTDLVWGQDRSTTRSQTKVEVTDKTFKSTIVKGFVVVIFTADYQMTNIDPKMIKAIEGHEKAVVIKVHENNVKAVVKKLRLRNYPSIALFHNGSKKKVWKADMDGNLGITEKDIKKEITDTLAGDVF
jgi:hypothetical protein